MKITKLETVHVAPRWLFLKMYTDEGTAGYGETIVGGRAQTVKIAVKELERYLVGKDSFKIEQYWQAIIGDLFELMILR